MFFSRSQRGRMGLGFLSNTYGAPAETLHKRVPSKRNDLKTYLNQTQINFEQQNQMQSPKHHQTDMSNKQTIIRIDDQSYRLAQFSQASDDIINETARGVAPIPNQQTAFQSLMQPQPSLRTQSKNAHSRKKLNKSAGVYQQAMSRYQNILQQQ